MLLFLALACTPSTEPDTSAEREPWSWTEDTGETTPEWTAAEAGAAIEAALAGGLPMPPDLWRATDVVLQITEEACGESERGFEALQSCTTSTGWSLYGFVIRLEEVVETEDAAGHSYGVVSDFRVVDPEGRTFDGGGELEWTNVTALDGTEELSGVLSGTWTVEAALDWLGEGPGARLQAPLSALLTVEATATEEGFTMALDGGVTLGEAPSLVFEELRWNEDCPEGATGTIRVRDAVGRWYDLLLSSEGCDGCGTLMRDEAAVGEACVDLEADLRETLTSLRASVEEEDSG